jgi:tRNA1Val (adenine37-N6)-methyltransferase
MANNYFRFKQFTIQQDKSVFKVGTDGVLLGACANLKGSNRILDIGSGTGLISIMIAQKFNAEIVTIEPDYNSYLQTCENIKLCKWNNRIKTVNISFQEFSLSCIEKFDLIITNPPYFRDSLENPDPKKSVARHDNSLSSYEILSGSSKILSGTGILQLILPYAEGNLFIAEARDFDFFCNSIVKIKPVPSGKIKRLILEFGREKKQVKEKFLTIEKGNRHDFTEEYKDLTRDFYLNF